MRSRIFWQIVCKAVPGLRSDLMAAHGEAHDRKDSDFSKELTPGYSTLLPVFPQRFPQLVESKIPGFSGDFSEMVTIITHCGNIRHSVFHHAGAACCRSITGFPPIVENHVEKLGNT